MDSKHWLTQNEITDSFALHSQLGQIIVQQEKPELLYFQQYAKNLRESFFTLAQAGFEDLEYSEYTVEEIQEIQQLYSIKGQLSLSTYISSFLDHIQFETSEDYRSLLSKAADLCGNNIQYSKQAEYLQLLLIAKEAVFNPGSESIVDTQNDLGLVYRELGQYIKAKDLLEQALHSNIQNFGDLHPTTTVSRSNLAVVYSELGGFEAAKDLLQQALQSDIQNFGDHHPATAAKQSNLAAVYQNLGDHEKAKDLFKKAYSTFKNQLGEEHPNTKTVHEWLKNIESFLHFFLFELWDKTHKSRPSHYNESLYELRVMPKIKDHLGDSIGQGEIWIKKFLSGRISWFGMEYIILSSLLKMAL